MAWSTAPEWPAVQIAQGVAFQGDGSISVDQGVVSFWRPVLFREETDRPVAGRMDCLVATAESTFSETAFDPEALHESIAAARERQGYVDMERLRDFGGDIRQLDIVGRRANPRQHYVLSYIMVRDGERLIDIRRNCTFIYGNGISRPDVLPYVSRYTRIRFDFDPADGSAMRADIERENS